MWDDPADIELTLLQRYALPSIERARVQFPWAPAPLLMFWMPIRLQSGSFDLLPDGMKPRKSDWHWVLAARTGIEHADFTASGVRETYRRMSAAGHTILDFVACSPDLTKVRGLLWDMIDVLGNPCQPVQDGPPIRVHATPLGWLASGCDGVVPVGREIGVQMWLRDCSAGLIADSVVHGDALAIKMRREVPRLPKVLVTA